MNESHRCEFHAQKYIETEERGFHFDYDFMQGPLPPSGWFEDSVEPIKTFSLFPERKYCQNESPVRRRCYAQVGA